MGGDITDLPLRRDGLEIPFSGGEGSQELDQVGVDFAEQMGAKNRLGTGGRAIHAVLQGT
jgi:hypothetical protein